MPAEDGDLLAVLGLLGTGLLGLDLGLFEVVSGLLGIALGLFTVVAGLLVLALGLFEVVPGLVELALGLLPWDDGDWEVGVAGQLHRPHVLAQ